MFTFAFYKAFAGNTSSEYLRPSLEEEVLPYPWWKNTSKFMLPSKSSLPPFCAKFQAIFDMVDSNGNGYVDFVEYMTAVSANRSTAKTSKGHDLIFVWIKGDESWGKAQLDLQCVWQRSGRIHWLLRDPSGSDQVKIILPHLYQFHFQDLSARYGIPCRFNIAPRHIFWPKDHY